MPAFPSNQYSFPLLHHRAEILRSAETTSSACHPTHFDVRETAPTEVPATRVARLGTQFANPPSSASAPTSQRQLLPRLPCVTRDPTNPRLLPQKACARVTRSTLGGGGPPVGCDFDDSINERGARDSVCDSACAFDCNRDCNRDSSLLSASSNGHFCLQFSQNGFRRGQAKRYHKGPSSSDPVT